MEFKDYYATLGLQSTATQDEIKRAYRKLARKFHPDVSKEADAEARFKELAEAYEALNDPERRAAYDEARARPQRAPMPDFGGGDHGFDPSEGMNHSDFFESLFGKSVRGASFQRRARATPQDHHARILIDLEDAYHGARRNISLRVPVVDAQGQVTLQARQLEVNIPKGVREGQHLRLAGQGLAGEPGGPAGDLYLEVGFKPHAHYRVDGRDLYLDLPIAPWEAALGATATVPTPGGPVQLTVPAGSSSGRKLRLKGRGLPGDPPGNLYAVVGITVPPADTPASTQAYEALARTFPHFNPRSVLKAG
ncbi:DnaJ C-terminal domain-containing protein [Aquabacterium sp. CECT 9606]|uniref:DnaJ C-terminal domain-containing protein n=1 Tax=Aquabacterium sp. CECT 9606 TaxID=2845822 RepID=UPI001E375CBA|nr:DnaJ C-terminal domain-containing protein [Aquabacterium sp. CECT 9606]CAH0351158.1 Curved DNA-binding protein [Aquabacterium sp. CECT 9606]